MTRYEDLQKKANKCRKAAFKTRGFMRLVWLEKANRLENLAANLPLNRANQKYEG